MSKLSKFISKPIRVLVIGSVFAASTSYGTEAKNMSCFEDPYFDSTISSEEAFRIAECFYPRPHSSSENTKADTVNIYQFNSQYLLLQYADSWYRYADRLGHPNAYKYLVNINGILNELDK